MRKKLRVEVEEGRVPRSTDGLSGRSSYGEDLQLSELAWGRSRCGRRIFHPTGDPVDVGVEHLEAKGDAS